MRARSLSWRVLAVFCGPETTVPPGQGLEAGNGAIEELMGLPGVESEVRCLKRPTLEAFTTELQLFNPNLVYICSAPGDGADWIGQSALGALAFSNKSFPGGIAQPQPDVFASLFQNLKVQLVYFDCHSTDMQAQVLHGQGVPAVISWKAAPSSLPAVHFARTFFSTLRSPGTRVKEAYEAAQASVVLHCQKTPQKAAAGQPPAPAPAPVFPLMRMNPAAFPQLVPPCPIHEVTQAAMSVKINPPAAEVRVLLCGDLSIVDQTRMLSLTIALRSLLIAEMRVLDLDNMVNVQAPAELFGKGVAAVRCDLRTGSGAHCSVTAGGPPAVLADKRVVEHSLRKQLTNDVTHLSVSAATGLGGVVSGARRSTAVAGGLEVVEVAVKTSLWAVHCLRHLAQHPGYRGLVTIGVAAVGGSAVAAYTEQDTTRLAAMNCYRTRMDLSAPGSLAAAGYVLINGKYVRVTPGTAANKVVAKPPPPARLPAPATAIVSNVPPPAAAAGGAVGGAAKGATKEAREKAEKIRAMQHRCARPKLNQCTEAEFYEDLVAFLNSKKAKKDGDYTMANFPDVVLNGSKLDMFNLYKEVVTRGGVNVGNGINWKGQVFNKMSNYTANNRMTGVGNALKKHYDQYLKDYEAAHVGDLVRDICMLCGGGEEAGSDWVSCAICDDWCHFDCDSRPGKGSFKDFAKDNGLEYHCPTCHGKGPAKKQKV